MTRTSHPTPREVRPRLLAITGPLEGRTFPLEAGRPVTVGRHSNNLLQLRQISVSRHHCALQLSAGGTVELRDLGSRHGTFVNGTAVRQRRLEDGDLISVGDSTFLLRMGGESGHAEAETSSGEAPLPLALGEGGHAATTLQLPVSDALYLRPERLPSALPANPRVVPALGALLSFGTAIGEARDHGELERDLLARLLEVVPAERAVFVLARGETRETGPALRRDGARGARGEPLRLGGEALDRVLEERVAVLANEVTGARSLLCVPLPTTEGVLGAIYLDNPESAAGAPLFDEHHLHLATAMAALAAPALAGLRRREWLEGENRRLRETVLDHDMVGESPAMERVFAFIRRAAPTGSTILIRGESGTGKELVARALHRNSPRVERPFVAINCAALSETLLESELFGHEKGAFTGAVARKAGKVEVAHTGTLFLDELGELPLPLQAKLLRVLEQREIERLGGTRPIRVDVRLIAATNRDLETAMNEGAFREDLYYRLNVLSVELPPLRERREDIPLLARHFVALHSRRARRPAVDLSAAARSRLLAYDWPGNVRELSNAIERAVVLGQGDMLRAEDLPETLLEVTPPPEAGELPYHEALRRYKQELLLDAVERAGGNITQAAELLGLHPNYLHRLLTHLGLRERLQG